jgi:Zn-dependent protease
MEEFVRLSLYLGVLAYSCILHECAHVWVAYKLGDPTGKNQGRLTLNPLPHIDLFWTIILPLIMIALRGVPFGGPKPAPVNPLNFRDPRAGFMWTSLAGPFTNILLAALGLALLWTLFQVAPGFLFAERDGPSPELTVNGLFFANILFINVFLAAFNLIPIPPLDGSRFLRFLAGRRGERFVDAVERLGILPLLLVVYFVAPYALGPVLRSLIGLLAGLFGPAYAAEIVTEFFTPVFKP